MRIMFLGLRGFPHVQGGIETHAENLCLQLVEAGFEIDAIVRGRFVSRKYGSEWRGVRFIRIWAPRSKFFETIVHSIFGVLFAAFSRPDVLHIQGIGPSLVTPFARLLGLKVIVTHHGPDYDRSKWGAMAKRILRFSEAVGMRWANARIVISEVIRKMVFDKYGLNSETIPNGVNLPNLTKTTRALTKFGLQPNKYVLSVSRLVPEKRHLDLLEAFSGATLSGWKLVLVGASDHPDRYSEQVLRIAEATPNVVTTGFQTGTSLAELFSNAGMFVLSSSHEGLPIALLEALSYGLPVVASAIPANLEIGLPSECYYPVGDVERLKTRLAAIADSAQLTRPDELRQFVLERFNWRFVAQQTADLYTRICDVRSESSKRVSARI